LQKVDILAEGLRVIIILFYLTTKNIPVSEKPFRTEGVFSIFINSFSGE
jgi:hypothetical protein